MSAAPRVSVIVAVYNPGEYLDGLVVSLLDQSLTPGEFEVIFVDDGSTDGSGRRVDDLAATHAHMQTIHIPNSGWPGRPRNLGIDAARGRYVYFVDHDDWLAPEALERLADRADRNEADVVIGKEVAHGGFGVPLVAFARSVDDEPFPSDAAMALLTPHKLFRRSMLIDHAIRFPEGKRRLEDHQFVIQAYFAARRISILADYPCYHWIERREKANATHLRIDPVGYYANMRQILDIVDAHTEPGDERDRLYAHWFRGKTLHKLRGPGWFVPAAVSRHRRLLFDEVRSITADRFGPAVDRHVQLRYRLTARAVRAGSLELVAAHARFTQGVVLGCEVASVEPAPWRLDLELNVALRGSDGSVLRFERHGDRMIWAAPAELVSPDLFGPDDLDAGDEPRATTLSVMAQHRGSRVVYHREFPFPIDDAASTIRVAGPMRVSLDLATLAAGGPLPNGTWDLFVRVECGGWRGSRRLPGGGPLPESTKELSTRPYVTSSGTLALVIQGSSAPALTGPPPPPAPIDPPLTSADRWRRMRRRLPQGIRRAGRSFLDLLPGR